MSVSGVNNQNQIKVDTTPNPQNSGIRKYFETMLKAAAKSIAADGGSFKVSIAAVSRKSSQA